MSHDQIKKAVQTGWDHMSGPYQSRARISLEDIHYGPLIPGEREYRLLGDVAGMDALELACGAAQNAVVLAKWGARSVVAMDISPGQVSFARDLCKRERVSVHLLRGDMEKLSMFRDSQFDIVLSANGWEYLPDLPGCLRECSRVLRPGGRLVVSTVHPLGAFEWDEEEGALFVTDYFNPPVEVWEEYPEEGGHRGLTFFHTIDEMFVSLAAAGFAVERIIEPYPVDREAKGASHREAPYTGDMWDKEYDRFCRVPFNIIYSARKAG
ncbi:MAG: class I SAM-dependent methyltransferase [SAR202 cluster bacterium]|nr:class I SAM-dependent methyltransferase [SAR202 cluster bacterium]